jgi:hypothetical protein
MMLLTIGGEGWGAMKAVLEQIERRRMRQNRPLHKPLITGNNSKD